MSRRLTYLDSSAIVKLVVSEAESGGLRQWIQDTDVLTSCALVRTEVPRAARPHGPHALREALRLINGLEVIALDDRLLDEAALVDPLVIRSLDAIHLAAARSIGRDLEAFVTYDQRMLEGARLLGLPTATPI